MNVVFDCLGQGVRIDVDCATAQEPLRRNFSALRSGTVDRCVLRYRVACDGERYRFTDAEGGTESAPDMGDLLYKVEHALVVDLQRLRRDLLFVHAATLVVDGGAVLLVAPSGTGKSTTALALLERGWGYLSDELAPIAPGRGLVHGYPHALCLKRIPPDRAAYPGGGFFTGRTWHLPLLPPCRGPLPLAAIVFLARDDEDGPVLHELSAAAAAARLFPEVLNGLAHPAFGIDAAIEVVRRCRTVALRLGSPQASASLLCRELAPCAAESPP